MTRYVALFRKEPGSCWGVDFPDVPGCIGAGDTEEDALENARQALQAHLDLLHELGDPIPEPTPLADQPADVTTPEANTIKFVSWINAEPPSRSVRVNISLQERLLHRVDRHAQATGLNRSAFIAAAVERAMRE